MNERIKKLVEQAGFTEGGYESDDGPWIGPEFNKEKFAELIVREAAELVKSTQITKDGHSWRSANYVVLEHFGVNK